MCSKPCIMIGLNGMNISRKEPDNPNYLLKEAQ